ncbi:MAG: BON domain-containing protein [Pirellulales bacterium]
MVQTLPAPASTSRLLEQISVALQASPYVPRQRVLVETQEGAVRLRGNVDSFFQKQMAQEVIRRLDGVEQIENLLEVSWT